MVMAGGWFISVLPTLPLNDEWEWTIDYTYSDHYWLIIFIGIIFLFEYWWWMMMHIYDYPFGMTDEGWQMEHWFIIDDKLLLMLIIDGV